MIIFIVHLFYSSNFWDFKTHYHFDVTHIVIKNALSLAKSGYSHFGGNYK